ncbi:hypothetical protein ACUN9Y_19680 [Halomonas sp. V046]|uniref:hypothetical protein n=1 Tax=Halomonas sp. V046 TaxID=3459611 RepID=UPI0040445967
MSTDIHVIESIFSELLGEVFESYKKNLSKPDDADKQGSDPYSRARNALRDLSTEDKQAIFDFIRLAMVDTSSVIFGTIDGSHFPENIDRDFSLEYDGEKIHGSLQDELISLAEDQGVYK